MFAPTLSGRRRITSPHTLPLTHMAFARGEEHDRAHAIDVRGVVVVGIAVVVGITEVGGVVHPAQPKVRTKARKFRNYPFYLYNYMLTYFTQ